LQSSRSLERGAPSPVLYDRSLVVGLMPVVGVPLPMVSYGGSALASMMFAIGVIMNVSMRRFIF
jgi:rod shape determining protein RodA